MMIAGRLYAAKSFAITCMANSRQNTLHRVMWTGEKTHPDRLIRSIVHLSVQNVVLRQGSFSSFLFCLTPLCSSSK